MITQSENIKEWTKEAKARKSKGFVDMCDTFNWENYPIYFGSKEDKYKTSDEVLKAVDGKNMQKSYGVFTV
jgi:hypothetical protein